MEKNRNNKIGIIHYVLLLLRLSRFNTITETIT